MHRRPARSFARSLAGTGDQLPRQRWLAPSQLAQVGKKVVTERGAIDREGVLVGAPEGADIGGTHRTRAQWGGRSAARHPTDDESRRRDAAQGATGETRAPDRGRLHGGR